MTVWSRATYHTVKMTDSSQSESIDIADRERGPAEEFVGFGVVRKPILADDAIAEALAIAEAIAPRTDQKPGADPGDSAYAGKLSLKQVIELTDKRLRALYQDSREDNDSLPEVLDLLDIEVELGRPDKSDEALFASPAPTGAEGKSPQEKPGAAEGGTRETPSLRAEVEKAQTVRAETGTPIDAVAKMPEEEVDAATLVLERARGKLPDAGEEPIVPHQHGPRQNERDRVVRKLADIRKGTYFDILEVPTSASHQAIAEAYRAIANAFASEKYAAPALADLRPDVELIRFVVEKAYALLSDKALRERYRKIVEDDSTL